MKRATKTKQYAELDHAIKTKVEPFLYNKGKGRLIPISQLVLLRNKERPRHKLLPPLRAMEDPNDFDINKIPVEKDIDPSKSRDVCWDLNERGAVGETILHLCLLNATALHADLAKRLLRFYPKLINDIYMCDEYYGENVLHLAIVNEDPAMVKYLLNCGANFQERCCGTFMTPEDQKASRTDSLEHEWVCLCPDTNYDGYVYWGEYPLSFAACLGQEECYRLMLARGADPDAQDTNGNTALHMLVIYEKVNTFDMAYEIGASLGIRNVLGLTPLTLAAKLARIEIFFHILNIEREIYWQIGSITCAAYPLSQIDTIDIETGRINKNSALNLVVFGDKDEHLELMDGVLVDLLNAKWNAFVKSRFYQKFFLFLLYFLVSLVCFTNRPGPAIIDAQKATPSSKADVSITAMPTDVFVASSPSASDSLDNSTESDVLLILPMASEKHSEAMGTSGSEVLQHLSAPSPAADDGNVEDNAKLAYKQFDIKDVEEIRGIAVGNVKNVDVMRKRRNAIISIERLKSDSYPLLRSSKLVNTLVGHGRENYTVGDVNAVLKSLFLLVNSSKTQNTQMLRRGIVEENDSDTIVSPLKAHPETKTSTETNMIGSGENTDTFHRRTVESSPSNIHVESEGGYNFTNDFEIFVPLEISSKIDNFSIEELFHYAIDALKRENQAEKLVNEINEVASILSESSSSTTIAPEESTKVTLASENSDSSELNTTSKERKTPDDDWWGADEVGECRLLKVNSLKSQTRLVAEAVMELGAVFYILEALREAHFLGLSMFIENLMTAPSRVMFLFSCLMMLIMPSLRFFCLDEAEDIMSVIIMLTTAPYFLFFCRGFKTVGPFVVMIYRMVMGDLLRFVSIYLMFVMGFSQAYYIIFLSYDNPNTPEGIDDSSSNPMPSPMESVMAMFLMSLTNFGDYYGAFEKTDHPFEAKLLFVVYMAIVAILLVNMLIAMMGNTYQKIAETRNEWQRQWARIVLVVERGVSPTERLRKLLAYSQPMADGRRALVLRLNQTEADKEEMKEILEMKRVHDRIVKRRKRGAKLLASPSGTASGSALPSPCPKKRLQGDSILQPNSMNNQAASHINNQNSVQRF
ncbi:uncharacterized protein LOC124154144 isoform X2 [Ischnura elegans]|nr:uncharacterized protein LOC124154144 isoform X2 [Ischnura elegans]XP_046383636.1 uncharacterized protein LOC124154144 isoform X2 [Ischnura elegans]